MREPGKFKAFLSCSNKDEAVVRRLHARLEAFAPPRALSAGGRARLGRFFRDEETSAALSAETLERLLAAEWLIVCCSADSVVSSRVDAIVDAFVNANGFDRALLVVLDGEPRDVVPPRLRARNPESADFRKSVDGEDIGFLRLAASLLNVGLGELRDQAAAAERARLRNRNVLAALLALAGAGAGAAAWVTQQQRERAEAMASEAVDIGAGLVAQADALSRRGDAPGTAMRDLLTTAEARFDRLFEQGARGPELLRRRANLYVQFSELYERIGDAEKSRARALAAIEAFERLPPDATRSLDYTRALAGLGRGELAAGREAEAVSYNDRAIESGRAALADNADTPLGGATLSAVLLAQGEIHLRNGRGAEALPLLAEAAHLLEARLAQTPDDAGIGADLMAALDLLGGAQVAAGDLVAARAGYERVVALARARAQQTPRNSPARAALGASLLQLARTLADSGDNAAARAPIEESVAIARHAVAAAPEDAQARGRLAQRLALAANVLAALRRASPELIAEATTMAREQVREHPRDQAPKLALARLLAVGAGRLERGRDNAGAREVWREAVALRRTIRPANPQQATQLTVELAQVHERVGELSVSLEDIETATAAYGEAVRLRRAALAAAAQDRAARAALAADLQALGLARRSAQNDRGAAASFGEAARLRARLALDDDTDHAIAALAAESLMQLAQIQATNNTAAARASLEQAREILIRVNAGQPRNRGYRDALRHADEALLSLPEPGG